MEPMAPLANLLLAGTLLLGAADARVLRPGQEAVVARLLKEAGAAAGCTLSQAEIRRDHVRARFAPTGGGAAVTVALHHVDAAPDGAQVAGEAAIVAPAPGEGCAGAIGAALLRAAAASPPTWSAVGGEASAEGIREALAAIQLDEERVDPAWLDPRLAALDERLAAGAGDAAPAWVHMEIGALLRELGRDDAARERFAAALAAADPAGLPSEGEWAAARRALVRVVRVRALMALERAPEAREALAALRADPSMPPCRLVPISREPGAFADDAAIVAFLDDILSKDPDCERAAAEREQVLNRPSAFDQAAGAFFDAVKRARGDLDGAVTWVLPTIILTLHVVFEDVLAPCSWTRPSIAGLLTGRHPRSLGIFAEEGDALPPEPPAAPPVKPRGRVAAR